MSLVINTLRTSTITEELSDAEVQILSRCHKYATPGRQELGKVPQHRKVRTLLDIVNYVECCYFVSQ